jgi:hypothetical protein
MGIMSSSAEVFRLGLLALICGIAIPLLVQLFLVLRSVQRLTGRLEATLAKFERASAPPPAWPALLAAAVQAGGAAMHAFRSSMARPGEASAAPHPTNNHAQEQRT